MHASVSRHRPRCFPHRWPDEVSHRPADFLWMKSPHWCEQPSLVVVATGLRWAALVVDDHQVQLIDPHVCPPNSSATHMGCLTARLRPSWSMTPLAVLTKDPSLPMTRSAVLAETLMPRWQTILYQTSLRGPQALPPQSPTPARPAGCLAWVPQNTRADLPELASPPFVSLPRDQIWSRSPSLLRLGERRFHPPARARNWQSTLHGVGCCLLPAAGPGLDPPNRLLGSHPRRFARRWQQLQRLVR